MQLQSNPLATRRQAAACGPRRVAVIYTTAVQFARLFLAFVFPLLLAGQEVELFSDDFSGLPPGMLSFPVGELNGAIQEYHYLPHRGVDARPWRNPIVHLDSWAVGDEDGKSYLEQHQIIEERYRSNVLPVFVTGDAEWGEYAVEAKVRPLSLAERVGVVFRYHHNRHYYICGVRDGKTAFLAVREPLETAFREGVWRLLAEAPFVYGVREYLPFRIEDEGRSMSCSVGGQRLLEASDAELTKGLIGAAANVPARFTDFRVSVSKAAHQAIIGRIASRETELARLRAENPRPKLWRRFRTPVWGTGRNVRFGDLNGDGEIDMLFAQQIPKVRGDAFDNISALTAVTLTGEVLWQVGRPDARNGLVTNDTPFQIHDLEGDGKNEVVLAKDFKLQVLDGKTGERLKWAWMPVAPTENRERPYELNNGDSIAFFDLRGNGPPLDDLDQGPLPSSFWLFDEDLRPLGRGSGQTGHYPYPFDFEGKTARTRSSSASPCADQATANHCWSRDAELHDHTDAISAGNFTGDPSARPRVYSCGSDEGFLVFGEDGNILKHVRLGHAQTQSVGQYRPETPELEILIANFWRNTGIVTMLDPDGNILQQQELVPGSSHLQPVNWRGDGTEFAMLHAGADSGGMIDGQMRRVVAMPHDGHPELAYQVLNVTGDARDELIVWDQNEVWIYTQDRPFTGQRVYAPTRNPLYNDSNYRSTVSLPAWR